MSLPSEITRLLEFYAELGSDRARQVAIARLTISAASETGLTDAQRVSAARAVIAATNISQRPPGGMAPNTARVVN